MNIESVASLHLCNKRSESGKNLSLFSYMKKDNLQLATAQKFEVETNFQ
jgi:hypothetical protein